MSRIILGIIRTWSRDKDNLLEFNISVDAYTTDIIAASHFCDAVKTAIQELAEKEYEGKT